MLKHAFREQWLEGTKLEYDTLLKLNTFRTVPLPEDPSHMDVRVQIRHRRLSYKI
jgi:hypothetical protein